MSSGNPDSAAAVLEVRQADGRFLRRGVVYDANGGDCSSKVIDIQREKSDVRFGACDVRGGVLGNCRWVIIPG